jgi:hypothetical protein
MYECPDDKYEASVQVVEKKVEIDIVKIETFAERLIRKHILKQYVEPDHPVLRFEENLVQQSTNAIKEEISILVKTTGFHVELIKMAVFIRTKKAARVMIRFHDLDEDTAEKALSWLEFEARSRILEKERQLSSSP